MSNAKVNYSDLVELGFKKMEINDCVHQSQYGYPYFILTYGEEGEQVSMEWSPVSREVNLYLNSHTYQTGLSLDEVKKVIYMLDTDLWADADYIKDDTCDCEQCECENK
jgi:hypothetical protein